MTQDDEPDLSLKRHVLCSFSVTVMQNRGICLKLVIENPTWPKICLLAGILPGHFSKLPQKSTLYISVSLDLKNVVMLTFFQLLFVGS